MTRSSLLILAGPNGSGKSTFFEQRLKNRFEVFINADVIAKQSGAAVSHESAWQAKLEADRERDKLLDSGASFCTETVLSHVSWLDFVRKAKQRSYEVVVIFICLEDPALNAARVRHRVSRGGHDVPMQKIGPRYERSIAYCAQLVPIADEVWLIDNTVPERPFAAVARFVQGKLADLTQAPIPRWVQSGFAIYLPSG